MSHTLFPLEDNELPFSELNWIDVRSEGEFEDGHVIGSINIPILNNEHRILVGTSYKQEGKDSAEELGYKLVSPLFEQLIAEAKKHVKENKIVVYCARGGMRSQIFSDLLSKEGIEVMRLKDGYKRYRNWCLEKFTRPHKLIVMSGKTGSQKTERLFGLHEVGEAVIDLEGLAHHKGSAFGALGQPAQPTQEHFENKLAHALFFELKKDQPVWYENESRLIGKVRIPDTLFNTIVRSPRVEIQPSFENRFEFLMENYGCYSNEELIEKTQLLTKRMGLEANKKSIESLENGDKNEWLTLLMHYYDKAYEQGRLKQAVQPKTIQVQITENTTHADIIAAKEILLS
jgi:tRNA 2-selenouridine synthase